WRCGATGAVPRGWRSRNSPATVRRCTGARGWIRAARSRKPRRLADRSRTNPTICRSDMHARDVSDDAVWHAGTKTFAALARQFGCDKKSLHAELHRRGWRKAGKSGVTYQAPCAECRKPTRCGPADPGGLDGRRVCRECRHTTPAEDEPEWKTWYRTE